ncbi:leucyl/phenylalanyl-tRNA--protein transferase [Roseomonas sp. CECT 9278]|uniref:leucyl/phenylalanyl-tRNA--protein transferase n=1 Tax=Roseomonas sp. CECT 9278 TaxID=2845823 RepID=UPI001E3A8196|nr:leucyl/phenylalanyl-tRNA--protein transferase [Roseomonas sp. CECT 9278]CAH0203426.1 Leucyl/phenylalanyl-tRNA--protein transferase [Roseomonas sp. CECT 9278]
MSRRQMEVTPDLLLRAYGAGVFPMAESRGSDRLYWLDPALRGVLPIDAGFHLPRRLRRTALSGRFTITADRDFAGVIRGCAEPAPGRADTWINTEIERLFVALHDRRAAHSIEAWQEGRLVGGLYGVALGGAFFGESMFSRATDASKVALVHLVARLRLCGFVLLDTQFLTSHLARFGAVEIPKADYKRRLADALDAPACWHAEMPLEAIEEEITAMRAAAAD